MSSLGRLEEFFVGKCDWLEYRERLEFYFAANGITEDEKKRAVFLSVCGPSLYSIIRSLCTPNTPKEVAISDILVKLNNHFSPKPSEILCRFKFNKRDQRPNESVSEFMADLRRLSEHCNFGDQLDSMLRDRLVCGLRDENIQRRLLADSKLTLTSALDAALAGEAAVRQSNEIRGTVSHSINLIKSKAEKNRNQVNSNKNKENEKKPCHRCGNRHPFGECKFIKAVCHFCKKIGHIQKMCNLKNSKQNRKHDSKIHSLDEGECSLDHSYQTFHMLHSISTENYCPPFDVTVKLNGIDHCFEIDSGSLHSVISSDSFQKLWPVNPPELTSVSEQFLRTWSYEKLNVCGYFQVDVLYNSVYTKLPLLVVDGTGKSLLGRSWFEPLGINLHFVNSNIHQLAVQSLNSILQEFSEIFSNTLGCFKGPPVSIKLDESCTPKYLKARNVPFALRDKVTKELERMVQKGILEPVTYSDWATPIVSVVKKDGGIRICGDYRSTVNQAVKQFTYPLPTVNEVLTTMSGGTVFSKLDLSEAYLQLPVDDQTSRILTLNTPKGLFKVNRLPFGVSVAVAIFQKRIEEVLAGIDGVLPYLDDIFIKGKNIEDHNSTLKQVLIRLKNTGIRLKREKCKFAVPEIELLGFQVNKNGIQPTFDKVAAIHNAPIPKNKNELQAFLGMLNFYGCFLKNRSSVLEPLYKLLRKDVRWHWTTQHTKAYQAAKNLLKQDDLLIHFDEKLPLILTCDASSYGLGAVLSHKISSGEEAPIAYYSRRMTKPEQNYSQTDREALAIVAAVKKFHQYLAGRKFTIVTDHKPLLGLFNPSKPLPQIISPRVLRWSLSLAAYDYNLEYRQGKHIANADALSRLPLHTPEFPTPAPADVLLLETTPLTQLNSKLIASATKKDPVLSKVLLWTLNGWPPNVAEEMFKPYFSRRHEISVHEDCVLWGNRVIIPSCLQKDVLLLLHNGHPGIVRMKGLARSYVWWPKMDSDVELTVKSCVPCQVNQKCPAKAPIHPWEWTQKPWSRLHIDFAGPFQGQIFFLVVDSHSKWLEVLPVSSFSSSVAIDNLRSLFATHGLPDAIVSDNATTFRSSEFSSFLRKNQIRQIFVAPYHPSSNGQAERMVATTKQALKRIVVGNWKARLARFLFSQHTLPCTATGKSPAELLMNRRLTSLLDRLHPDLNMTMFHKKELHADSEAHKRVRSFINSDPVYVRNYSSGTPWVPAVITETTGPLSYKAQCSDGTVVQRHVDQIRDRLDSHPSNSPNVDPADIPSPDPLSTANLDDPVSKTTVPDSQDSENIATSCSVPGVSPEISVPTSTNDPSNSMPSQQSIIRRSARKTCRPRYLADFVSHLGGGKGVMYWT